MNGIGVRVAVIAAMVCAVFGVAAHAAEKLTTYCGLPSDFAIVKNEGLSKDKAVFLGMFSRKWQQALDHLLIVEKIDTNGTAAGYYAYGMYPAWRIMAPGCSHWKGTVSTGELRFTLSGSGANVTYRFIKNDGPTGHALDGKYVRGGRTTPGYFVRVSD